MAAHAETKARFFAQEELVIVRAHFGSTGDTSKTPSIEFSGEAGELGSFEELGEDLKTTLGWLMKSVSAIEETLSQHMPHSLPEQRTSSSCR